MDTTTLDPNILIARISLNPRFLKSLIETIDKYAMWKDSEHGYFDGPTNQACEISAQTSEAFKLAEGHLQKVIKEGLDAYNAFNPFCNVIMDHGYLLLRYREGEAIKVHSDHTPRTDLPNTWRLLSMILYLNDDYQGGELIFPRQKIEYKPKAGDLVMFPSGFGYPHGTAPVTSGIKYCIVSWFA